MEVVQTRVKKRSAFALRFFSWGKSKKKEGVPMNKKRAAAGVLSVVSGVFTQTMPVFASGQDLFEKGTSMLQDLYDSLVQISTPIAIVAIVVSLLGTMFTSNQRRTDEGRHNAKLIAVTWAVIMILGYILTYARTWIGDGGMITF